MSDSKSIPTEPRSGKDPPPPVPVSVERGEMDREGRVDGEMERGGEGRGEVDGKEGDANTAIQIQTNEPSHLRPTILTQAPSDYHPLSSDRTNSNPEANTQPNPTIQTQPRFESGLDPEPDPEPSPPKNFQGFFVLVDDVKTGISTHPRQIKYLFSDDEDVGGLTGRLLGCLPSSTSTSGDNKDGNEHDRYGGERDGDGESLEGSEDTYRLRRGDRGGSMERREKEKERERTIIIDISPTGDAITSIHSLTSSWQVVNGVIGKAPTFESSNANSNSNSHTGPQHTSGGGSDPASTNPTNTSATHDGTHDTAQGGNDGGDGSAALMLRVKGVGKEAFGGEVEGDREEFLGREGEMGEDEMRGLLEGFERRLGLLRKVVQGGGGG